MVKKRVMVVEDSLLGLMALELLLEQHDCEIVATASTVTEALTLAGVTDAEIAILDINLNGEMVFPAAELLVSRGVPIIFTTGYVPDQVLPPHLATIPALQKPYSPAALLDLLDQTLARADERRLPQP